MELKEGLSQVAGKEFVADSPEELEPYSKDYSLSPVRTPDYVVKPKNKGEDKTDV